jgi:hypothetical protein
VAGDQPATGAEPYEQGQGRGVVAATGGFRWNELDGLEVGADGFGRASGDPSGFNVADG